MTRTVLVIVALGLAALMFAGCQGSQPARVAPTADTAATESAIAQGIFATLTAAAPGPQPAATAAGAAITSSPARLANTVAPTIALGTAPTETGPAPRATALPPTATPVPPTSTASATPSPVPTATAAGPMAQVQSETLNVRDGPGTGHPVVDTAKQGESLPISGRNQDGTWLEVTLAGGQKGWVSSSLLQVNAAGQNVAVVAVIPTPPAAPTAAPQPAAGKRDLEVTFINPHYDCQQGEWQYTGDDGDRHPLWGYRSFQVDMYVKNNASEPVSPPWQPKRWIITDGRQDVVSGIRWQWVDRQTGFYQQPTIQPGQSAGWTFLAFPVDRNQWVKAVEFMWNGQVYRGDFDLGTFGNNYNYKDCGEPRPHTDRPTPTPKP